MSKPTKPARKPAKAKRAPDPDSKREHAIALRVDDETAESWQRFADLEHEGNLSQLIRRAVAIYIAPTAATVKALSDRAVTS